MGKKLLFNSDRYSVYRQLISMDLPKEYRGKIMKNYSNKKLGYDDCINSAISYIVKKGLNGEHARRCIESRLSDLDDLHVKVREEIRDTLRGMP